MGTYRKLENYIKQDNFKLTLTGKIIDIENYTNIDKIDEKEIIIFDKKRKIIIKGSSLSINKLLNSEILIIGNINSINFEGKVE